MCSHCRRSRSAGVPRSANTEVKGEGEGGHGDRTVVVDERDFVVAHEPTECRQQGGRKEDGVGRVGRIGGWCVHLHDLEEKKLSVPGWSSSRRVRATNICLDATTRATHRGGWRGFWRVARSQPRLSGVAFE